MILLLFKSLELWGILDTSIKNVEVRQSHYGHRQFKYTVVKWERRPKPLRYS